MRVYNIYYFVLDENGLESFKITCALNFESLATQVGYNRCLLTLLELAMSRTALIFGLHGVGKQNFLTRKRMNSTVLRTSR